MYNVSTFNFFKVMNKQSGLIKKKIHGQDVTFKFGTNSFALFCEVRNISMQDGEKRLSQDNLQLGDIRDIIWSGAASYCRLHETPEPFNRYTIGEWLDDGGISETDLVEILDTFRNSKIMGKSLGGELEEDKKKEVKL